METIRFVPAAEADAGMLGELRQKVWAATYRGIYPDDMIDRFDYAWHREKDLLRIQSPRYKNWFIQWNGKKIGYLVVRNGDGLLLQSLYLLPEAQKKGIGKQAFSFVRQYCAERGIPTFHCHCQPDNGNAMAFYQKMGGKVVERDEGNQERWQDAVVFEFLV